MRKLRIDELHRISAEEFKAAEKLPLVVVLDNVRSLYNIGSVFRTSDAFRVEKIILCGVTACPPNQEIHKTALGAENTVGWEFYEDTLSAVRALKEDGFCLCAIEQVEHSVMLGDFVPERSVKYAVVFGNEVKGVRQDVVDECDVCIEIPQFGTKHSLNVSVTSGIVIWHFFNGLHS